MAAAIACWAASCDGSFTIFVGFAPASPPLPAAAALSADAVEARDFEEPASLPAFVADDLGSEDWAAALEGVELSVYGDPPDSVSDWL